MQGSEKNLNLIGLCYIILSILFGLIMVITFSYMPVEYIANVLSKKKEILNYTFLFIVVNFLFSALIGSLVLMKKKRNKGVIKFILLMMLLLIFIDLPPILHGVWHYFATNDFNCPWTIAALGFHLCLLIYFKRVTGETIKI